MASTRRVLSIYGEIITHTLTPQSEFSSARSDLNHHNWIWKPRVILVGFKMLCWDMYITLAGSNRALQNIQFKWVIKFPNLILFKYSNFSILTCKLQTNFESYRCRTQVDSKKSLIVDLNLIIFVTNYFRAGQHFSSHCRY